VTELFLVTFSFVLEAKYISFMCVGLGVLSQNSGCSTNFALWNDLPREEQRDIPGSNYCISNVRGRGEKSTNMRPQGQRMFVENGYQ